MSGDFTPLECALLAELETRIWAHRETVRVFFLANRLEDDESSPDALEIERFMADQTS